MNEKEEKKMNLEEMLEDALPKTEEMNYEEQITKLKQDILLSLADMENLRKRHAKEKEDISKFAVSSALSELIIPFEHLFVALNVAVPENLQNDSFVKSLLEGTSMVQKEFERVFTKLGLKRIYPVGEKFDPNFHQAVSQIESKDTEAGIVINVVAAGFELNGRILRPAMVIVSK